MTSLIWLALALYFWPTQQQINYCIENQWSQEVIIVDWRLSLSYEAKWKREICSKLLQNKKVKDVLKDY